MKMKLKEKSVYSQIKSSKDTSEELLMTSPTSVVTEPQTNPKGVTTLQDNNPIQFTQTETFSSEAPPRRTTGLQQAEDNNRTSYAGILTQLREADNKPLCICNPQNPSTAIKVPMKVAKNSD